MGSAAGEKNIRLLPDNTGKRLHLLPTFEVDYDAASRVPVVGETITGATSGLSGTINYVYASGASAGLINILPDDATLSLINSNTLFTDNEDLQVDASTIATANGIGYPVYFNSNVLSSGDNPFYHQRIDNRGAAFFRFTEGSQQFDAFGLSRVTSPTQIGEYIHAYDELPDEWYASTTLGGSVAYVPNESAVKLVTSTTASSAAQRTTHKYHRYQAGVSQLTTMTIVVGDTGKANVRRRWGYFDDENGVFFELNGTTLSVVMRSNVTGTPVDTSVAQSAWNTDRVDGGVFLTNPSLVTLDVSLLNIYWIDLQWLGAGQVRCGIYSPNGERVTCHIMQHANDKTTPYMTTASLPLRVEQLNTGLAGSASEIKQVCAAVFTEGPLSAEHDKWHHMHTQPAPQIAFSSTEVPIMSIRSTPTIGSKVNRVGSVPEIFAIRVQTEAVRIRVLKNAVLTGAVFSTTHAALDIDTDASAIASTGTELFSLMFPVGVENCDVDEHFNYLREYMRLDANGSANTQYTITGQSFGASSIVDFDLTWFDHYSA